MMKGLKHIRKKGYDYRGWKLGETVIYNGRQHKIIGFSLGDYRDFIAIDSNGCTYPIDKSHRDVIYMMNKNNTFLWVSEKSIVRKNKFEFKNIFKFFLT
ncbi:MAG: hypothetical protein ACRC1T_09985 [Clostridium chrysemydis]|uniref:hypothetical protein n=1 Tax=Clostridium chrysemydis TaxID=2665504 RepID=UPI003F389E88